MKTAVIVFALVVCAYAGPAQNRAIRIGGGNTATAGQFPHTASLQFRSGGIVFKHVCTATIISPNWSIVPAQCRDSFDLSRYRLVAGILNQGENNPGTQITGLYEFILHPQYRPGGKGAFDIGLLLHEVPLEWTNTVGPAALPQSGNDPTGNAVISGWGSNRALGWANLALPSHDECAEAAGSQNDFDNTQICTANSDAAVCGDDVGGSLTQDKTVIGMHSWSPNPCGSNGAFYVKVESHLDFIYEHVDDV